MIFEIESREQAVKVLRLLAEIRHVGTVVFVVDQALDPTSVPAVLRKCKHHDNESEYCGWNIWCENESRESLYCKQCGCVMDTVACASLVVRSGGVFNDSFSGIGCKSRPT